MVRLVRLVVLVFVLALAGWLVARVAVAKNCRDRKPTTWDIEIGPPSEPGERLVVTGRVVSMYDGKPLAGMTVYAYHADAKGDYGNDKAGPRLCGILITNARGEYQIRTSMPGGYEGYPAHLHYEVWGPHVSHQHAFVNLMLGQAVMDTTGAIAQPRTPSTTGVRQNLTSTDRPVFRGRDGVHRCTRDLAVVVSR